MASRRLRVKAGIGRTGAHGNSRFHISHTNAAKQSAKAITDSILDILDQFEQASEDLMLEALEPTFELSKKYCPVDTGDLVASGYLEKVGFRGKPRVEIGYGRGGNPDYAAYVHEMVDIPHVAPTRSKWLQAAVMEDLDNIYNRLGASYRAFMNGGSSSK